MPKARGLFEVECPCCGAALKVEPETRAVISFKAPEKPRTVESLEAGLARLRGEAARREEAFQKSAERERRQAEGRPRKFDELLKQAKASPDEPPRVRDIDLD
jgi:uncharacterized Zn finger protein (UPF0148 family)